MSREHIVVGCQLTLEELDALWFFDLGYYLHHTFWEGEELVDRRLEAVLETPLSEVVVWRAIRRVNATLKSPYCIWPWFGELSTNDKQRFLAHWAKERARLQQFTAIVVRLAVC